MRSCAICYKFTKGSHFGVDACRGCAEFFRRSIVDKRQYYCKNGEFCFLQKSNKRLCRKCRLDKCFAVGMQASGVYITTRELRLIESNEVQLTQPSTSCENVALNQPSHLQQIWKNYQDLCVIRTETEKRLDPEGYKSANKSGLLKGMYHATPKIWNLFTRAHTPTVMEFVANSFQGYQQLNKNERETLLRPFLIYFWWIEGVFRVYKKVPKELYTSLFLVSDTSYMDVDRQDKLFDCEPSQIPSFLVNDLMSLLKKELRPDRQRSSFLMHDMKTHDYEFIALTELLFWNSTVEGCSDELHRKIHKGRARVMIELDRYYKSIEEPEPFIRIGELMNIQNAVFIEIFRCREDMESFKIFDAFESFDFVYKVIKDI